MTRFDDYVERATERLRADPFVHRDVRRELEAHLEDAAEEARAGGAAEDEAQEHALRACGDADALAEQLYEANRIRMRLRWWGKWATRLVLVPAALALAVVVGVYGLGLARRAIDVARYGGDVWMALVDTTKPSPRPDLTEDQKWLFKEATASRRDPEPARAIMERFPRDPAAYAYYIRRDFEGQMAEPGKAQPGWIAALERGRRVDPDNALYDYLLAYTLLAHSTQVVDEKGITFEYRQSGWRANPEPKKVELPTLKVTDPQAFRQAMDAVEAGFRKPLCTGRVAEWEDRMQGLWAEPKTYEELLAQWTYHAAALMPHLQPLRVLTNRLPATCLLLDGEGARDEAVRVTQQMDRPGVQVGADAQFTISILVGFDIYARMAGSAPVVLERMGDPQAARSAERTFQDMLSAYATAMPARTNDSALVEAVLNRGGMMAQEYVSVQPGFKVLPLLDATRLAEHVLAERIVLAALLAGGSIVLLLLAASSAWSAWRHPEADERPLMLFIGWRRLALVVLIGVALPLALYALETRVAPWRSLRRGISLVLVQRAAELVIGAALLVFLAGAAAYRAVRARCADAGLPVPQRGYFNPLRQHLSADLCLLLSLAFGAGAAGIVAAADSVPGLGLTLDALVVAMAAFLPVFLLWQMAHLGYTVRPWREVLPGLLTAARRTPIWLIAAGTVLLGGGAVLVYGTYAMLSGRVVAWIFVLAIALPVLVYAVARTKLVAPVPVMLLFRRTFARSLIPVLAACVLAFGLFANAYLSHAEAAAISPLNASGYRWYNEVGATDWAAYRAHLKEVNAQWLAQRGITAAASASTAASTAPPAPPSGSRP